MKSLFKLNFILSQCELWGLSQFPSPLQPYALFTAAPFLIFSENESEAVRDRLAYLQWAVLLFNVFSDCSAHKTLEKYL